MSNVFVVLSTYNGGAYLRPLIESIRNQSHADWTLLVRDDGSQDQTFPLLREAAADRRIVLLENRCHCGAAASFGHLMQEAYRAGGEYLAFADQDDVWFPDKLERLLEQMRIREKRTGRRLPHLVYSDLKVVNADLRPIHPSFLHYSRLRHGEGQPLRILLGRSFVLGCACMVNRPLMEFALPLPATVASHDWWTALCAASVGQISYLAQPMLLFRRHPRNTSGPAGFWAGFNPLRYSWSKRWQIGRRSFWRSLEQARALRDRLHQRSPAAAEEATKLLDCFCRVLDLTERAAPCSYGAWRRLLELHRLGVPAIDLPRRILYGLCVLCGDGEPKAES